MQLLKIQHLPVGLEQQVIAVITLRQQFGLMVLCLMV